MAISTYGWTPPKIKMIQKASIFKLSDNASTFKYTSFSTSDHKTGQHINNMILTVEKPNNRKEEMKSTLQVVVDSNNAGYITGHYENTVFDINLNMVGEYRIEFSIDYSYSVAYGRDVEWVRKIETATTYIYVNPDDSELKPYSLGDTIRRVLNLTPTRTADELPKYTFDPVQLKEYDKEESPEFAFTGHTLFEALLMIAQYKGAFPQLNENGVISFRKLWNDEQIAETKLPPPIDEISCSDINQYCTYLDTDVQNLVGVNNSQTGSIVEPYAGGYKTTRAASGSEISQDTAIISTDYNQYLHIKEEIGYINGEMPANNDLTAYVYESGDYYALTDMSAAYPASKAYALQWAQMGQNITELTHRIESKDAIGNAFIKPAIANIIQAKTGISYDTGVVSYICSLINPEKGAPSFADLMFRTTYIPVINSRIKQYKENFTNFRNDGSIKYNQTAELVDSELYGEHLKQLIRKIGNVTKRKIYIFDKIDDVPQVGTVVDGYSIYDIQMSIRENKVIATISFVKYAELSQYIGVKNPWKDSDVSTDKCYKRNVNYGEFLMFSHTTMNYMPTAKTLSADKLEGLLPSATPNPLTCVMATGFMKDGTPLNTVLLPVISLAVGNSIMFQWGYQNNYSAGYMSENAPDGATSVISGTKYNKAQKAVKYSDTYGKLETLSYYLMPSGPVPQNKNMVCFTNNDTLINDEDIVKFIANSLPLFPEGLYLNTNDFPAWTGERYISVENLLVEKNSSEALTFITQYHFCSIIENFIIGSGLTNFCPLIGGAAVDLAIYGFEERLNIFNRRISVKDEDLLFSGHVQSKKLDFRTGVALRFELPVNINARNEDGTFKYKAWAYVGRTKPTENFQIIFGENRNFKESAFERWLFLYPEHKLEDFI